MQYVSLLLIGIVLGVANIIPGVSGGTIAVVFNVYERLLSSILRFKEDPKGNLKFLVPVLGGCGVGILAFAKLITYLLANHPVPTNYFFIGLIIGSIPMLLNHTEARKINVAKITAFAIGIGVMLLMVAISPPDKGTQAAISVFNMQSFFLLLFASALAAIAMIIPGISGSFLMLILGTYATVTASLSSMIDIAQALIIGNFTQVIALLPQLLFLLPVALGVLIGLLSGAKLIDALLEKARETTYCGILGLVIGSIFVIFPGFVGGYTALFSGLSLAAGAVLAFMLSPSGKK